MARLQQQEPQHPAVRQLEAAQAGLLQLLLQLTTTPQLNWASAPQVRAIVRASSRASNSS